ncbi:2-dehydro-3-deoxygalactonokinase [Vreelandella sp. TE19]
MKNDIQHVRQRLDWIAADWGSSNLRVWAMDQNDQVIAQEKSDKGMLALSSNEYEGELYRLVTPWLAEKKVDVLVCGMAGARQGWREAAYLALPAALDRLSQGAVHPPLDNQALKVHLLPGVSQRQTSEGFDVMRGEETQLAGLVADTPEFNGLACLPGTHAKWARLENGALTRFATFLTGELYELLARQSVLRHSIGDDENDKTSNAAFQNAVRESFQTPARFSSQLFRLRAQDLLDSSLPQGVRRKSVLAARLSGLVIGLELAGAAALTREGESVTLIGGQALTRRYGLALDAIERPYQIFDGDTAVIKGLSLARRSLTA